MSTEETTIIQTMSEFMSPLQATNVKVVYGLNGDFLVYETNGEKHSLPVSKSSQGRTPEELFIKTFADGFRVASANNGESYEESEAVNYN